MNWEKEIINGIRVFKEISYKNIKHSSNGYKNFDRFRNRILYSPRNDSVYRLIPVEEQLCAKRLRNKNAYNRYKKTHQKKNDKNSH